MDQIPIARLQAAQRGMRDRADSALKVSRENVASLEYAAAMRGKARGYRECADMLEPLIRQAETRNSRIDLQPHTGFPSSLTWDAEARAFYLGVGGPVEHTDPDDTGYVNVDVDVDGHLAGVEIFVNTEEMEPRGG